MMLLVGGKKTAQDDAPNSASRTLYRMPLKSLSEPEIQGLLDRGPSAMT